MAVTINGSAPSSAQKTAFRAAFDVPATASTLAGYGITDAAPKSHSDSAANPHSTTAAQVGADATGTAAGLLATHAAAADPHPAYALKSALGTASAAATTDFTPAAHAGAGGTAHAAAVAAGAAGFMSGADKTKIDGIAAGAQVNPASTDALTEGSTNLYSTAARIRATLLTGLSTAAGTVVAATHTVLEALGFLQKQVSDNATAISGKQATLVSGTNLRTVNGATLLGSTDLAITSTINNNITTSATYATTAAGLAATSSGQYFSVPSANINESVILYLNSAGVAVEQKRYPSAQIVALVIASTKQGSWFNDTFTEAAQTALTSHGSDSGHGWVFAAGNATAPAVYQSFGGVVASGSASVQVYRISLIAPTADVMLSAVLSFDNANYNFVGIAARLTATGTAGYLALYNRATSHWEIHRLGAALVKTLLASSAYVSYGSGVTPAIEFSVSGSGSCVDMDLKVGGVTVCTASDDNASRVTEAGYAGVWFDTTAAASGVYINSLTVTGAVQTSKPRLAFRAPYIDLADYDVDPTFTVDSTAGIQQAILDAFSRKIEKIKGLPGRFKIAGPLNAVTNSQLYIPYSAPGNANRSIYIEGSGAPNFEQQGIVDVPAPTNGMIFESTIAGSGTSPALLGVDNGGTGMTLTNFGATNMGFRTRVSAGANSISALNLSKLAQLNLLDMVRIDVDMGLQSCPTPNAASCGIIMPRDSNHAMLNVGAVYISGYYTGAVLAEHAKFDNLIIVGAVRGIQLEATNHGSHIGMYLAEHVAYPIWIAGNHPLTITHYTTEHNANIAWATYVRDIHNTIATRKIAILRSSVCIGTTGYDDSAFASNDAAIYKIVVGSGAN